MRSGEQFESTFENTQWKKPHECNQCDHAFLRAGSLRTHLKTHNEEKSQKCNQCDYASYEAGNLKTHLKRHIDEKSISDFSPPLSIPLPKSDEWKCSTSVWMENI